MSNWPLAVLAARLVVVDDLLEGWCRPARSSAGRSQSSRKRRFQRVTRSSRVEGAEALADVLQRVLHQLVLAEDGAARLVDQLAGVGAREAAVGEQAGDDDARRGRADGAGEQALGRVHRLGVALRRRAALVLAVAGQRAEGGVGALAADVAGRELVQVGERGGARRRLAAGAVGGDADEALGLAELGRGRLGRERDRDVERDVRADAPQQAVELRVEREAAEGDGAEPADAGRAVGEQVGRQPAGGGEGRHRDGPDPAEEAGADPGDRSGRGGAAPEQAADQRRRELGDGGEGDQADRRRAGRPGRRRGSRGRRAP